jgi:hypothetical protein
MPKAPEHRQRSTISQRIVQRREHGSVVPAKRSEKGHSVSYSSVKTRGVRARGMASSSGASRFPLFLVLESGNQPPHHRHPLSPFHPFCSHSVSSRDSLHAVPLLLGEIGNASATHVHDVHDHAAGDSGESRAEQAEDGERKIPAPSDYSLRPPPAPARRPGPTESRTSHASRHAHTHMGWGWGWGEPADGAPLRPLSFDKRAAAAGRVGERDPTICHVRRGWIASPAPTPAHTTAPHPSSSSPSCSCLIDLIATTPPPVHSLLAAAS